MKIIIEQYEDSMRGFEPKEEISFSVNKEGFQWLKSNGFQPQPNGIYLGSDGKRAKVILIT